MQESAAARHALLRFYEAFGKAAPGDEESFERVFTREQDLMIIGTAAHEWVEGREKGAKAWGSEGIRIEPGEPRGWEHDPDQVAALHAVEWSEVTPSE